MFIFRMSSQFPFCPLSERKLSLNISIALWSSIRQIPATLDNFNNLEVFTLLLTVSIQLFSSFPSSPFCLLFWGVRYNGGVLYRGIEFLKMHFEKLVHPILLIFDKCFISPFQPDREDCSLLGQALVHLGLSVVSSILSHNFQKFFCISSLFALLYACRMFLHLGQSQICFVWLKSFRIPVLILGSFQQLFQQCP